MAHPWHGTGCRDCYCVEARITGWLTPPPLPNEGDPDPGGPTATPPCSCLDSQVFRFRKDGCHGTWVHLQNGDVNFLAGISITQQDDGSWLLAIDYLGCRWSKVYADKPDPRAFNGETIPLESFAEDTRCDGSNTTCSLSYFGMDTGCESLLYGTVPIAVDSCSTEICSELSFTFSGFLAPTDPLAQDIGWEDANGQTYSASGNPGYGELRSSSTSEHVTTETIVSWRLDCIGGPVKGCAPSVFVTYSRRRSIHGIMGAWASVGFWFEITNWDGGSCDCGYTEASVPNGASDPPNGYPAPDRPGKPVPFGNDGDNPCYCTFEGS